MSSRFYLVFAISLWPSLAIADDAFQPELMITVPSAFYPPSAPPMEDWKDVETDTSEAENLSRKIVKYSLIGTGVAALGTSVYLFTRVSEGKSYYEAAVVEYKDLTHPEVERISKLYRKDKLLAFGVTGIGVGFVSIGGFYKLTPTSISFHRSW